MIQTFYKFPTPEYAFADIDGDGLLTVEILEGGIDYDTMSPVLLCAVLGTSEEILVHPDCLVLFNKDLN